MNYSTAVFLINPNARAILATYEAGDNAPRTMFKTFDPAIKVNDLVVVPTQTRHGFTVVKVVAVDVDVDFDSPVKVDWVAARVDLASYADVLTQEAQAIRMMQSAEARKKRNELAAALMADQADTIMALPIAIVGGPAVPPVQPPERGVSRTGGR